MLPGQVNGKLLKTASLRPFQAVRRHFRGLSRGLRGINGLLQSENGDFRAESGHFRAVNARFLTVSGDFLKVSGHNPLVGGGFTGSNRRGDVVNGGLPKANVRCKKLDSDFAKAQNHFR
jgi:hypothetical protein